jgi:hypothetical protein
LLDYVLENALGLVLTDKYGLATRKDCLREKAPNCEGGDTKKAGAHYAVRNP